MSAAGMKRRLPEHEQTADSDRPHKKRISSPIGHLTSAQQESQDKSTQSSHAEHTSGSDLPSTSTQPTSQERFSDTSPPEKNKTDLNKIPRIPKRPADEEVPRPRKRPGAGARVDKARSDAVLEKRKREQEEETLKVTKSRGGDEYVKQHYNAVPQRGREWRNTDSKIKGLRKYNNWVKSVIINRFSKPDDSDDTSYLKVLDMGCGKGGDLQKWNSTPHPVALYVGIDPAEVSIDQARDRYAEMRRGGGRGGRGGRGGWRGGRQQAALFEAEFVARDAFGQPVAEIPVVQHVGFDAAGNSRWGGGGFDVVSMMFCMHYAFESEAKTRGMLANVAGSLKKGGRFIGVIPNSDVIRSKVQQFHADREEATQAPSRVPPQTPITNGAGATLPSVDQDGQLGQSTSDPKAQPDNYFAALDQTTPDPVVSQPDNYFAALDKANKDESLEVPPIISCNSEQINGDADVTRIREAEHERNGDQKSSEAEPATVEWGNSIYRVRFPGKTPSDGIFRPPFGWKYNYFLEEAVEEVPEYVVPWEAFRALAEDFNLEQSYRKPFAEIWKEEQNHRIYGPLSERMGVRGRDQGPLLVSEEEMEAASFYHAFCFYKV